MPSPQAGSSVPLWSPDLPEEQKDEVLRTSLKELRASQQAQGTNLIKAQVETGDFTTASASLEVLARFSTGFPTSGGLCEIAFRAVADLSGGTGRIVLSVDGAAVDQVTVDATTNTPFTLLYKAKLAPGNHKVTISGLTTGGATLTLGAGDSYTGLWITEVIV